MEVDIVTYSDSDFSLVQSQPFANGLTSVGTNALHMQIRTTASDPTVWFEGVSSNGTPSSGDTANGYVTAQSGGAAVGIFIPQSILAKLPPGAYVYSLIMSSNDGANRTEVFRGTHTHNAGPTTWTAGKP